MRIRIRIQEAKAMRIQADPDPSKTFESKKDAFYQKNIHKVSNGPEKLILTKVQKPF
jgi:hypothetical protein